MRAGHKRWMPACAIDGVRRCARRCARHVLTMGASMLALLLLGATASQAQTVWTPQKPVKIVVPYPAGGPADLLARLLGEQMSVTWKHPVLIDNRSGAAGMIGAQAVAAAPADGHTLLFMLSTIVQNPHLFKSVPYDVFKDFEPVSEVVRGKVMFVIQGAIPANTLAEFIDLARASPGKYSYGTYGIGSGPHTYGEMLNDAAGIAMTHVPYRGQAPVVQDMLGGQIPAAYVSVGGILQHLNDGRFKVLAAGAPTRSAQLPNVPTFAEQGYPALDLAGWYGMFAPAGTPAPTVLAINAEIARIVHTPAFQERMAAMGIAPVGSDVASFKQTVRDDYDQWGAVIRQYNIKAE
ncbi:MAG: tripartite tricarboxylate transporter substrate binding protein [Burkholderiaceae bacterium]